MQRLQNTLSVVLFVLLAGCSTMRTAVRSTADTKTWDAMNECAKQAKPSSIPDACAQKFKETPISGNVRELRIDNGSLDLRLTIPIISQSERSVTCQLDAGKFKTETARLSLGDSVTVQGEMKTVAYYPELADIILNPCELTNSPALSPK